MVVYEYEGIIDWFKENILGQKSQVKKEEKAKQKKEQAPAKHQQNMMKNILIFGGIAILALMLLSKGEQMKKQTVGG